jgi:hypothetical protein
MFSQSRYTKALSPRQVECTDTTPVTPDHILQLFDTDESLARAVAGFLSDGVMRRETMVVVATQPHWNAITVELEAMECDPVAVITDARLVVLDADDLLARFMRRGQPNRALFEQTVGALVARLSEQAGGPLRIYGEMVERLAQEGNYWAAEQLEQLWNDLRAATPFKLLCGYSAAHFAAPDAGSSLAAICGQHAKAVCHDSDPLGQFLLNAQQPRITDGGPAAAP